MSKLFSIAALIYIGFDILNINQHNTNIGFILGSADSSDEASGISNCNCNCDSSDDDSDSSDSPTLQPSSEPSLAPTVMEGCSDTAAASYPLNMNVFACAGVFDGRISGGILSASAQALCGVGYEVCPSQQALETLELDPTDCNDLTRIGVPVGQFFGSGEATAVGRPAPSNCDFDGLENDGVNNLWGCSSSPGAFPRDGGAGDNGAPCDPAIVRLSTRSQFGGWTFGTEEMDPQCIFIMEKVLAANLDANSGGVLCCKSALLPGAFPIGIAQTRFDRDPADIVDDYEPIIVDDNNSNDAQGKSVNDMNNNNESMSDNEINNIGDDISVIIMPVMCVIIVALIMYIISLKRRVNKKNKRIEPKMNIVNENVKDDSNIVVVPETNQTKINGE